MITADTTPQEAAEKFTDCLHEIGNLIAYGVAKDMDQVELLNFARDTVATAWKVPQLVAANMVRLANQVYAAKSHGEQIYSREELAIIFAKAFPSRR